MQERAAAHNNRPPPLPQTVGADALHRFGRTYHVPTKFGLLPFLLMALVLAMTFALLRRWEAPPFVYAYLGILALTVTIFQSRFGHVPRRASMLAGIVLSVGAMIVQGIVDSRSLGDSRVTSDFDTWFGLILLSVPFGALIGYLVGAVAAGIFLITDLITRPELRRDAAQSLKGLWRSGVDFGRLPSVTAGLYGDGQELVPTERKTRKTRASDEQQWNAYSDRFLLFNCIVYVSRSAPEGYEARFAQLEIPACQGRTMRAVLQTAAWRFRDVVTRCLRDNTAIPWHAEVVPKLSDEIEQWIPIYVSVPHENCESRPIRAGVV
jgi:hypothetical protein